MSRPSMWVAALVLSTGAAAAAEPVADVQERIGATLAAASPAVVSLWYGTPLRHVTGTCTSADGTVLTCGHLKRAVGDEVEVRFPGKPAVTGKVAAKHPKLDVAIVRLMSPGPWPFASLGAAKGLSPRDPLLGIGYGTTYLYAPDAPLLPYMRLGYWQKQRLDPQGDELLTTVPTNGGDSGGPLFDLAGGLLGVCSRGEAGGTDTRYVSANAVLREWETFAKGIAPPAAAVRRPDAPPSVPEAMAAAMAAVRPAVVEVQVGRQWTALGAHVGRGLFVTKASELPARVTLLLGDGTIAEAEVAARDSATDLALLRIFDASLAEGLAEVRWAKGTVAAGRLVAAATPAAFTPPAGLVCLPERAVPPVAGGLPVEVADGEGGAKVLGEVFDRATPWLRLPACPLKTGDVVTAVAGQAVRSGDTFRKLLAPSAKAVGRHLLVSGEAVEVSWTRDGKPMAAWVNLRPGRSAPTQKVRPYSYRHSGFAAALATDLAVRPEHCGAPAVDAAGGVVGVVVAKAPYIETLVIPAAESEAAVGRMIAALTKK